MRSVARGEEPRQRLPVRRSLNRLGGSASWAGRRPRDQASPPSPASSSEIASMASDGACGSRCTAWTSSRPAWRSALRSSRADEPVAEQEGKDVIAVLALVGRRVNLDPVVEVKEPQCAGSLPDERIERRQQRPRRNAARPARVTVKVGEPRPARNLDRLEHARLEERLDRLSRIVRAKTKIVAQVPLRGDAERLSGAVDERALRVLLVRSRQGEDLGRNDALGQVVDPLEAAAPSRRRDVSRPEQPLERPFRLRSIPTSPTGRAFLRSRRRRGDLRCGCD